MIHIGNYWGRKYDFTRFYLPFRLKYNIRFTHWWEHGEIIRCPTMYDNPSFVPGSGSIVFDIGSQYGDFSLLWEKRNHAIVYAFEALPENYAEMQRDFALNKSSVHSIRTFVGNGNPIEFENTGTMATKKESINPKISTMRIGAQDGKPRIIVDQSKGFPELETVHRDTASEDMEMLTRNTEVLASADLGQAFQVIKASAPIILEQSKLFATTQDQISQLASSLQQVIGILGGIVR